MARPKNPAGSVRTATIGVRVSAREYDDLRAKAHQMGFTPAQWLREAALTRSLPSPPISAINREHYADLARLAANLNQLSHAVHEGKNVIVSSALLEKIAAEVKKLRLSLLGMDVPDD